MTIPSKITTQTLLKMKRAGERITMVTAYDATFSKLAEQGGAEVLLVGDSLGMVVQGEDNTLGVTLDDIIYHSRAVRRGAPRAHLVADMPFMTYHGDRREALANAGRLLKEGRAESVKLEGGEPFVEVVSYLVRAGIPVMGHIGLTPQSVHAMGGFKVQGQSPKEARRILRDAKALEEAGAYAVVLEGIPKELARMITRSLEIPTIGIGAGPECDGQVLVIYDMLGMNTEFRPKFVKPYLELGRTIPEAIRSYVEEVKDGRFPEEQHCYASKTPLFVAVEAPADEDEDDVVTQLYGVPV